MIKYTIPIYTALEEYLPGMDDLVTELNQHMADFGFNEKISIATTICTISLRLFEAPSPQEVTIMRKSIQESFDTTLGFPCQVAQYHEWESEPIP